MLPLHVSQFVQWAPVELPANTPFSRNSSSHFIHIFAAGGILLLSVTSTWPQMVSSESL